jgi:type VI secretion system protein ImpM
VAEIPAGSGVLASALESTEFYDCAERLVVETLAEEEIDFDTFDRQVTRLMDTLGFLWRPRSITLDRGAGAVLAEAVDSGWHVPLGSVEQLGSVWSQMLSQRLTDLFEPLSMWWTDGSTAVEPSCVIVKGLPAPDTFKTFLEGSWATERFRSLPAIIETEAPSDETLPANRPVMSYRSAAASDVGRLRTVNQDAFLERPDSGLWVVADGLGGHRDGDVASRMVCDALVDFAPPAAFDEVIEAVRLRLREVNDELLRTSARALRGAKIGSTVAALIIRGEQSAAIWAGDSRIYRWRNEQLQQVTRDHSASVSGQPQATNIITRAVGVQPNLMLDVITDDVQPGDRFLLCSDGLTRRVSDEDIEAWMHHEDIQAAVGGLVQATLDAGAPDNVTVVIVEAAPVGP